jgi:hypothetical protein
LNYRELLKENDMCIFHKWSDWQKYIDFVDGFRIDDKWTQMAALETRQKRRCAKCGRIDDRLIKSRVLPNQ